MARQRLPVLWVTLLCVVAIGAPTGAAARTPRQGTLGAGLHAVATGKAPDASIVSRTRDGRREVAVAVEVAGEPDEAIRGRLRSAGLDLRGTWRRTIEGYVRSSHLERLAGTPGVVAVRAIRAPLADAFIGPGPALHGATTWHQGGFTGAGVKVGILDGGFDGFAARLGSELPASVQALCFTDLGVSSPSLSDCVTLGETHGTAVAESIVDMAPNAELFVSNAVSPADLAAAIAWMTGNGVRVINYSRASNALMDGMGDGTSPYSDSDYALLDTAVAGGALFVASAGNSGDATWTGTPNDTDADGWVEFLGQDEANQVALRAGESISVALRWPSAASDYDLLLYHNNTLVESSEEDQAGTGDPFELLEFTSTAGGIYDIKVRRDAGPASSLLKLLMWAPSASLEHFIKAGSLPTPADSRNPGMVSVGAVRYDTPTVIEPYSSQGPTLDGRVKPDLVAADCAPTTIEAEFCGTSQSAPFVTGAAALLLEADPSLTPAALAALLKQRAVPLGSPVPNNVFGAGRLALGPTPASIPTAAAFVAPPASGTAAAPLLGQPTVAIVDADGRWAVTGPGATMPVTLSLAANPTGATLTCAGGTTQAALKGVAAFTGCSVDLAGTGYTIRADVPGLASATSAPFAVAPSAPPGAPPQVAFAIAPTTVTFGKAMAATIGVALPQGAGLSTTVEWSTDARTWTAAGDVALDATGSGRTTTPPRRHGYWRARTSLPDGSVAVSAATLVRVNATATLTSSVPSGRTVTRTTRITLAETIRPADTDVARGRARFDLYLLVGSTWVRKRTLYAYADPAFGRARATVSLPSAGRWWVRSRAEPTATNGASAWTSGVRYTVR